MTLEQHSILIFRAIDTYEHERRPVSKGHVSVGYELYWKILTEIKERYRFMIDDPSQKNVTQVKIAGWEVLPDPDRRPMEWFIVPA